MLYSNRLSPTTKTTATANPRLWIDLSSFNSCDDFIDFCKAIHADEYDPELMAQDYEGFLLRKRLRDNPRQWYNEGFMSEDGFTHILEYSDMCGSSL